MSNIGEETPRSGPACDQCNVRKIKCRVEPSSDTCLACQHSSFRCTRLKVHKRRGPKRTKTMAFEQDSQSIESGRSNSADLQRSTVGGESSEQSARSFTEAFPAGLFDGYVSSTPRSNDNSSFQPPWSEDIHSAPLASTSHFPPNQVASSSYPPNPFEAADSSIPELNWASQNDTLDAQSVFNSWGILHPQTDEVFNTLSFFAWAQNANADISNVNNAMGTSNGSDFGGNLFESPIDPALSQPASTASLFTLPENTTANQCCDVYIELFRPWCPVLSRQKLKDTFSQALRGSESSSIDLADSIAILVETRSSSLAHPTVGPRLERLLGRWSKPMGPDEITIEKVMTSLHLFLTWEVLGEGVSAWLQFHQAVTLAELLGVTDWRNRPVPSTLPFKEEDCLRLFYTLFIIERAHAVLQHTTQKRPLPLLRLPDDAYGTTAAFRALLPRDALDDFPMDHLRLFSLVKSAHIACWGDTCSASCDIWTVEKADRLQQELGKELETSIAGLERPASGLDVRRSVNLAISIAWFRDRFWNVCLRHQLIRNTGPSGLQYRFILDNLETLIGALSRMSPADFGVGLDYGAKLSAMAITAISILNMARSPQGDSPDLDLGQDLASLKSNMSGWVYKIIGLLSARPKEHDALLKSLVQALAPVI